MGEIMKTAKRFTVMVGVGAALLSAPAYANDAMLLDWETIPVLRNNSGQALKDLLNSTPVGQRSVRVFDNLSNTTVADFFGTIQIDHVFADYEGLLATTRTVNLVSQVQGSAMSSGAGIGNFALDPFAPDSTQPNPNTGFTQAAYLVSNVNMANEKVYPGSPGFRSPASGNSTAPNIRSALFTLPLHRITGVEMQRDAQLFGEDLFPADHKHVPYLTRFNNWGNNDLNNTTVAGHRFAWETTDQLLSRDDFAAMVTHARLRGVDDAVLFQPGVIGYTKAQMRGDAMAGWNLLNIVFELDTANDGVNPQLVTPSIDTLTSGVTTISEDDGTAWSGVVNDNVLTVLVSNLDEDQNSHIITLPDEIAGRAVLTKEFEVFGGEHQLIEFGVLQSQNAWVALNIDNDPFGISSSRAGIGVPEPASLVMLAIGSVLIGLPRADRKA